MDKGNGQQNLRSRDGGRPTNTGELRSGSLEKPKSGLTPLVRAAVIGLLVYGFGQSAIAQTSLFLDPPDFAACGAATGTQGAGVQSHQSGLYRSAARPDQHWHVQYSPNGQSLSLTWFTHRGGRPVWYYTQPFSITQNSASTIPLLKATLDPQFGEYGASIPIGAVAVTRGAGPNDQRKLALSWRLDDAPAGTRLSDCLTAVTTQDSSSAQPLDNNWAPGTWQHQPSNGRSAFRHHSDIDVRTGNKHLHFALFDQDRQPVWLRRSPGTSDANVALFYSSIASEPHAQCTRDGCPETIEQAGTVTITPGNVNSTSATFNTKIPVSGTSFTASTGQILNWGLMDSGSYLRTDLKQAVFWVANISSPENPGCVSTSTNQSVKTLEIPNPGPSPNPPNPPPPPVLKCRVTVNWQNIPTVPGVTQYRLARTSGLHDTVVTTLSSPHPLPTGVPDILGPSHPSIGMDHEPWYGYSYRIDAKVGDLWRPVAVSDTIISVRAHSLTTGLLDTTSSMLLQRACGTELPTSAGDFGTMRWVPNAVQTHPRFLDIETRPGSMPSEKEHRLTWYGYTPSHRATWYQTEWTPMASNGRVAATLRKYTLSGGQSPNSTPDHRDRGRIVGTLHLYRFDAGRLGIRTRFDDANEGPAQEVLCMRSLGSPNVAPRTVPDNVSALDGRPGVWSAFGTQHKQDAVAVEVIESNIAANNQPVINEHVLLRTFNREVQGAPIWLAAPALKGDGPELPGFRRGTLLQFATDGPPSGTDVGLFRRWSHESFVRFRMELSDTSINLSLPLGLPRSGLPGADICTGPQGNPGTECYVSHREDQPQGGVRPGLSLNRSFCSSGECPVTLSFTRLPHGEKVLQRETFVGGILTNTVTIVPSFANLQGNVVDVIPVASAPVLHRYVIRANGQDIVTSGSLRHGDYPAPPQAPLQAAMGRGDANLPLLSAPPSNQIEIQCSATSGAKVKLHMPPTPTGSRILVRRIFPDMQAPRDFTFPAPAQGGTVEFPLEILPSAPVTLHYFIGSMGEGGISWFNDIGTPFDVRHTGSPGPSCFAKPTNVAVTATSELNGFRIAWQGSGSAVQQYQVGYGSNGELSVIGSVSSGQPLSYEGSLPGPGTYHVGVRAVGSVGFTLSDWASVPFTSQGLLPPTISAVEKLSAEGQVRVTYSQCPTTSTACTYQVRSSLDGFTWSDLSSPSTVCGSAGCATTGVIAGATSAGYSFQVRACVLGNCSAYSASSNSLPVLFTPVPLLASISGNEYRVTWNSCAHGFCSACVKVFPANQSAPANCTGSTQENSYSSSISTPGNYKASVQFCRVAAPTDCTSHVETAAVNLGAGGGGGGPATSEDWSTSTPSAAPAPAAVQLAAPQNSGLEVGSVAGSFRVDEGGNASYSIPIFTPTATGGLAPQLAMSYSSGSASGGHMGTGWSLSGVSAIVRCRKTVEHGDGPGPHPQIKFNNTDAYCLDGQRLILMDDGGGTDALGTYKSYRTEMDAFANIRAYDELGVTGGPALWVVYGKDGLKRYFGLKQGQTGSAACTANCRGRVMAQTPNTAVMVWLLSRVDARDAATTSMEFDHSIDQANGEFYLSTVRFSGHRSAVDGVVQPFLASITLQYQSRIYPRVHYSSGSKLQVSQLLKRIEVRNQATATSNPVVVRSYDLGYITPVVQSALGNQNLLDYRLETVTECAGSLCYPATTFTWNETPDLIARVNAVQQPGINTDDAKDVKYGDINGDGRLDIIWSVPSGGNQQLVVGLSRATNGALLFDKVTTQRVVLRAFDNDRAWQIFDYNQDGRDDVLIAETGGVLAGKWNIYLSKSTGTLWPTAEAIDTGISVPNGDSNWTTDAQLSDINGDGLADLIVPTSDQALGVHMMERGAGCPNLPSESCRYKFSTTRQTLLLTGLGNNAQVNLEDDFTDNFQVFDANSDGRADLLAKATVSCSANAADRTPSSYILKGVPIPAVVQPNAPTNSSSPDIFMTEAISGREGSTVNLRVKLSDSPSQTVSFAISFEHLSTNIADFTVPSQTFTFPAGTTTLTQDIAIQLTEDDLVETDEVAILRLVGVTHANVVNDSVLTVQDSGASETLCRRQVLFVAESVTAESVVYQQVKAWTVAGASQQVSDVGGFRLADINGDGLADAIYAAKNDSSPWWYELGTGSEDPAKSFAPRQCVLGSNASCERIDATPDVQIRDYDRDGDLDFWTVLEGDEPSYSLQGKCGRFKPSQKPFAILKWTGDRFAQAIEAVCPKGDQTNIQLENNLTAGFMRGRYASLATHMDLDGDGLLDEMLMSPSNAGNYTVLRQVEAHRYRPSSSITAMVNGTMARTEISYAPQTFSTVYGRDYSGPGFASGRGSPVMDVSSPGTYVVARVRSSSPTASNANFMRAVRYFYAGSKIQGNGRGSLGFRVLSTFDEESGIQTLTEYFQDFPRVGIPKRTRSVVRTLLPNVCFTPDSVQPTALVPNGDIPGCFKPAEGSSTVPHDYLANATGVVLTEGSTEAFEYRTRTGLTSVSPATQVLASGSFALPASPSSLFVAIAERRSDHNEYFLTNGTASSVWVKRETMQEQYDANGNVLNSTARTDGVKLDGSLETLRTVGSTFHYSTGNGAPSGYTLGTPATLPSEWVSGLLLRSTVTTSRPSTAIQTRTSEFNYHSDGSLRAERVLPTGMPNVTKVYERNAFAQTVLEATCSSLSVTNCISNVPTGREYLPQFFTAYEQGNTTSAQMKRASSTVMDASFRYVEKVLTPINNGSANVSFVADAIVDDGDRDIYGSPTKITSAKGIVVRSNYNAFGRKHSSLVENGGVVSTETLEWCSGVHGGSVSCPSGAIYRSTSTTTASATNHVYYDRLGRTMLTSTQSFSSDTQFNHVATQYDAWGRAASVSEPYAAAEASFQACSPGCTTSLYDVLGRTLTVTEPNGQKVDTVYGAEPLQAGAVRALTKTLVDQRLKTTTEWQSALGEVVQVRDAQNLTLTFSFDALGQATEVKRSAAGISDVINSATYNAAGFRVSMSDPDAGQRTYTYNALGEVLTEVTPNGACTNYYRDMLGRVIRRVESTGGCVGTGSFVEESTAIFTYDLPTYQTQAGLSANAALGALIEEKLQTGTQTSVVRKFTFDALARPVRVVHQIDSESYSQETTYDQHGRVHQSLDVVFDAGHADAISANQARKLGTQYEYNARGYQTKIVNATAPGDVYYEVKAVNARGQVTESVRGNNATAMTTTVEWDAAMGRLRAVRSGAGNSLQNWQYDDALGSGYDPAGNLLWRKDVRIDREERFAYDDMNRLTESRVYIGTLPQTPTTFDYDVLGNLKRKGSQLQASGSYVDPSTGSAVSNGCARTGRHFLTVMKDGSSQTIYCYDANGNQVSASSDGNPNTSQAGARRIQYTVHDKPSEIFTVGQHYTRYRYGPNHEIVRRSDGPGAENTSTVVHYVGGVEVYIEPDANGQSQRREFKRNLGGFLIINLKRHVEGGTIVRTSTRRFVFQDKLGSTDVITDRNGAVIQRMSFDVWGQRRAEADWSGLTQAQIQAFNSAETRKGYTGHEMVDTSNLIHMGGRIYDPHTARFLNADIHVQAPLLTQSYNRYAYVLNNPMNYTDPSGYSWLSDNWRAVVAAVISVAAPYLTPYLAPYLGGTMGSKIFLGMVSGAVSTGSLRGALTGGFTAGLMHGIGDHFGAAAHGNICTDPAKLVGKTGLTALQFAQKIAAHAVAGGVSSVLNGGKFGHGFLSAGVVEALSPVVMRMESAGVAGEVIAAAVVGGTASALSGGKFKNGAMHGAAMWAFNHVTDEVSKMTIFDGEYVNVTELMNGSPNADWPAQFEKMDALNACIVSSLGEVIVDMTPVGLVKGVWEGDADAILQGSAMTTAAILYYASRRMQSTINQLPQAKPWRSSNKAWKRIQSRAEARRHQIRDNKQMAGMLGQAAKAIGIFGTAKAFYEHIDRVSKCVARDET